jgi:hypothetical protein
MAGSDCESQVFANVPEGFIKLLVSIAKVAIAIGSYGVHTLPAQAQRQRVYAQGCGAIQGRAF